MLLYSAHADTVIVARKIDKVWVEATLAAPDWIEPDPADPTVSRAFKQIEEFGNRVRRVAYRPVGADILAITVFFDRGARR